MRRCLDVGGDPLRAEPLRHSLRRPDEPGRERARAHADEEPLGGGPDLLDRVLTHVDAHLGVHSLCRAAERKLTESDQIALAEEVLEGLLRLVGHVDLALFETLQEIVGREVDQLDLVGLLEDRVRHRLSDDDAGDLGDDVVEALDVLDVHRRVDVDASVEQLAHVLPPLGVTRAGRVGVGQLVDQDQGRTARERAVQVEFAQGRPPIVDDTRGEHLEPLQKRLGLRTPVGLDVADDHIHASVARLAGGLEHGVRLADARRGAEKHLQLAAALSRFLFLDAGGEGVRVGPSGVHGP